MVRVALFQPCLTYQKNKTRFLPIFLAGHCVGTLQYFYYNLYCFLQVLHGIFIPDQQADFFSFHFLSLTALSKFYGISSPETTEALDLLGKELRIDQGRVAVPGFQPPSHRRHRQ